MYFVALYIYGAIGTYGTKILACAATDASFGVDCRDGYAFWFVRIYRYHGYSSCRAMPCAVTAMYPLGSGYAGIA